MSKIEDFITGKALHAHPEELVRQEYARVLHDEYGYPKDCMDIEIKIPMGSSFKSADIGIYSDSDKSILIGLVELKRPDTKSDKGKEQLKSYMSAVHSCRWGVFSDGTNYEYAKKTSKDIIFPNSFVIPKYGEDVSKISSKDDLEKVIYLKRIFKQINNYLYSNSNLSKNSKQGAEMVRIIFCKLFDEISDNRPLHFQVREDEEKNPQKTKDRISKNLWEPLKNHEYSKGIFTPGEKLELEAVDFVKIVRELQRYSLIVPDKDVIGEAFQVFGEKQFTGERGQFFTPRIVVDCIIDMINPKQTEKVLDPACGSGGFLIGVLENSLSGETDPVKRRMICENYFHGRDIEEDLVKICKLHMVLMGDGNSNIVCEDSLEAGDEHTISSYDVILTNPPFGSKIKVSKPGVLKHYDLGHKWKLDKKTNSYIKDTMRDTPPQVLFIELCHKHLKKGGRLGIVLPEGVFGNPQMSDVREWIYEKFIIKAVIDCPATTFMPYTGTKTCVAIMEKKGKKGVGAADRDKIFFAIAENVGHTMRGMEIFDKDKKIREDFTIISDNFINNKTDEHLGFWIDYKEVLNNDILVPRYYDPRILNQIKELKKNNDIDLRSISSLEESKKIKISGVSHAPHSSSLTLHGDYRYVRTADIRNHEISIDTKQRATKEVYESCYEKQDIQVNDILFVKDGDHKIGHVAMVGDGDEILVQGHFYKIRAVGIDPYLLFYLLNTEIVKNQIRQRVFIQSTLGTIGARINSVLLPFSKNDKTNLENAQKMKDIISKRQDLLKQMETINI